MKKKNKKTEQQLNINKSERGRETSNDKQEKERKKGKNVKKKETKKKKESQQEKGVTKKNLLHLMMRNAATQESKEKNRIELVEKIYKRSRLEVNDKQNK